MTFLWAICYALSLLAILIFFDKDVEAIALFADLLKVLISGFLGYLIRSIQGKT